MNLSSTSLYLVLSEFPASADLRVSHAVICWTWSTMAALDPDRVKATWRQRAYFVAPVDASGVWRFESCRVLRRRAQHCHLPRSNATVVEAPAGARYAGLRRLRVKHLASTRPVHSKTME